LWSSRRTRRRRQFWRGAEQAASEAAGEEIEITKHGRTVARLVPASEALLHLPAFAVAELGDYQHHQHQQPLVS
jgi:antitoxin (DNA-binding transcriptional repressor) of toxin-antitoxin stability system